MNDSTVTQGSLRTQSLALELVLSGTPAALQTGTRTPFLYDSSVWSVDDGCEHDVHPVQSRRIHTFF